MSSPGQNKLNSNLVKYISIFGDIGVDHINTNLSSADYWIVSAIQINPYASVCKISGAQDIDGYRHIVLSEKIQINKAHILVGYIKKF